MAPYEEENDDGSKSKGVKTQIEAKSIDLYWCIKDKKWNEFMDRLDYREDDAREWIKEINSDGTERWKSLPIHLLCEMQPPLKIVKNLIRIYPESVHVKNSGGDLPLHIACRECASKEVTEFLLLNDPFKSAQTADDEGRLPLHLASRSGTDVKIIKDLLNIYSKAARTPDDFGLLPLHWACAKNASSEIVESLLADYPYAVEAKDAWDRTPLVLVKISKNPEKARITELLSRDASFWTTSMMSTIVSLSSKITESERMEVNLKRSTQKNGSLIQENTSLKNEIKNLHFEIKKVERHFLDEIEALKFSHAEEIQDLKEQHEERELELVQLNDQSQKRIEDLKTLVDELVEKLKRQRELVDEKEEARKELKNKAMSLVKRLQGERKLMQEKELETRELKFQKLDMIEKLEEKDSMIDELRSSFKGPMRLLHM